MSDVVVQISLNESNHYVVGPIRWRVVDERFSIRIADKKPITVSKY